jgi:hypothetical protein
MCFHLCLCLKRIGEAAHVVLQRTLVPQELHVGTIHTDLALLALGDVVGAVERSETPLLRDNDLLATGELVLAAAKGFDGGGTVCVAKCQRTVLWSCELWFERTRVTGADRENDLADVDTGDGTVRLAEGSTHSGLQSIGAST